MNLAATIGRSLQAGRQADLRAIERAIASGTRDAGRGLKSDLCRQTRRSAASPWREPWRPEASIEPVAGAAAIKSATLAVTVDYESETSLSQAQAGFSPRAFL